MNLSRLPAALGLSAALFAAGCTSCHHHAGCAAPAAPACGCNGPAGPGVPPPANPYPPPGAVTTPPPGAVIQR